MRQQGLPGLLQTLSVLIAGKLNMKKPPKASIVRRVSVTMAMDAETFGSMFDRLPSAPNLLQVDGKVRFSVPFVELDNIMPTGWSLNTFKTSTTCRVQPGKPVEIALLESKKVFYDHSRCSRCQGGGGGKIGGLWVILPEGFILPREEQASPEEACGEDKIVLGETQKCLGISA